MPKDDRRLGLFLKISVWWAGQPADRPHLLQPAGAAGRGELPAAGARPPHRGARGQRGLSHHVIFCTDKKEKQIFLIYREIQSGAVAKSYMTNGLLIYGEIFAHFLIY